MPYLCPVMISGQKADIIAGLQTDILRLQGFKSLDSHAFDMGLDLIRDSFPNGSFPLGCIHEFLSTGISDTAATSGFIAGMLSSIVGNKGVLLWISAGRRIFPPALRSFGIHPDRCIFIDLKKEKEVMWAMDESLKCNALSAVVGEIKEISFTDSRRLQLAVEKSQVTGFLFRQNPKSLNTTACVSRWKITQLPSIPVDDLPGVGFPQWKVELLRVRNGKPGSWNIQFSNGRFSTVHASNERMAIRESLVGIQRTG